MLVITGHGLRAQSTAGSSVFHIADSLFSAGRWQQAAQAYQSGLKADATNSRGWYRLGMTYRASAQYKEAIDAFQKSLALPPSMIPPAFIRAELAKTYALEKDSVRTLEVLSGMVGNGYGNFTDLDTASAYQWMKGSPRFIALVAKARSNAFPCLDDPRHHEFDFWLGEWTVYQTGTNYEVGRQRIEKGSGGCLVLENWTATSTPGEGKSMNFIAATGKWEQVWMGSGGAYLHYYNGEYRDGVMRYEGDGLDKQGKKILFHLSYFNLGSNSLRQLLESSSDDGKTWTTLYDFTYKRKT